MKGLIDETYGRVKRLLTERRAALDRVAEELQRRETIGREELERIAREAGAGKSSAAAAT